jgi:hypothetical protein
MRAQAHELQCVGLKLAVNQQKVAAYVTLAIALPIEIKIVVAVASV